MEGNVLYKLNKSCLKICNNLEEEKLFKTLILFIYYILHLLKNNLTSLFQSYLFLLRPSRLINLCYIKVYFIYIIITIKLLLFIAQDTNQF